MGADHERTGATLYLHWRTACRHNIKAKHVCRPTVTALESHMMPDMTLMSNTCADLAKFDCIAYDFSW